MNGEEGVYRTPTQTIFISPLSGLSQLETCLVCVLGTECPAHHPPSPCRTTDLRPTPEHALQSRERQRSVVQSSSCHGAAGYLEATGIWLELSASVQAKSAAKTVYWRPVEATHLPKLREDCCLETCRDHSSFCSVHRRAFEVVLFCTQFIFYLHQDSGG